jgi:pimeloyl-ACP methyl ester carboxylesterase
MNDSAGLYCNTLGEGENIVFLHGFLENEGMWHMLPLEQLKTKCWFIDLPGHGNSSFDFPINKNFTLTQVARRITNFLSFSGVQKYNIVGHSLGGYIALAIKSMDENCHKIVLMNSNFWQDDDQKKQNRTRFAELIQQHKKRMLREIFPSLFFNPSEHVKHIVKMRKEAGNMEATHIAAYSLAMRNRPHFRKVLRQFPSEIALIHGEKDPLISGKTLQKEMINLHNPVFNIGQAGHMSHLESPQELMRIFKLFLQPKAYSQP